MTGLEIAAALAGWVVLTGVVLRLALAPERKRDGRRDDD